MVLLWGFFFLRGMSCLVLTLGSFFYIVIFIILVPKNGTKIIAVFIDLYELYTACFIGFHAQPIVTVVGLQAFL